MGDKPSIILPGLWQGGEEEAQWYKQQGVTHVVNLGATTPQRRFQGSLHIPIQDEDDADLTPHLKDIVTFIQKARVDGGTCYVHCAAGVSRSSAAVLAYLMAHLQLSYKEAYQFLGRQRDCIRPNPGFEKQLRAFEKEGRDTLHTHLRTKFPKGTKALLAADRVAVAAVETGTDPAAPAEAKGKAKKGAAKKGAPAAKKELTQAEVDELRALAKEAFGDDYDFDKEFADDDFEDEDEESDANEGEGEEWEEEEGQEEEEEEEGEGEEEEGEGEEEEEEGVEGEGSDEDGDEGDSRVEGDADGDSDRSDEDSVIGDEPTALEKPPPKPKSQKESAAAKKERKAKAKARRREESARETGRQEAGHPHDVTPEELPAKKRKK